MRTAAVLIVALMFSTAWADNPEREAKALFNEGKRLTEEGDYTGAIDLFRKAYARYPNPKILWNLAAVLERQDRLAEAADTYEQFIRHPSTEGAKRTEGARALVVLEAQLGKLRIEVAEPEARVVLDGREIGTGMSFIVRVDPGSHTVVAEKVGLPPAAATVDVVAGMERTVTLRPGAAVGPRPAPAAASSPPAVAQPSGEPKPQPTSAPAEVVATVEPAMETLSHRGQLGLTVRSETDARTGETGPSAGVTYGITSWLEVAALALVQETKGARVAGSVLLVPGASWVPFVRLGVPVFFADGARPGIHVAGGLLWDVTRHAGLILDAGIEYLPTVPEPFHKAAVVVGLGFQARAF